MFAGYLCYGLWYAFSIYQTLYFVECQAGQALPNGKGIGLWVAGDNVYGVCVVVANLVLLHRLNLFDKTGMAFYVFSVGSYFLALWLQSLTVYFPKVFGSFGNAWG